MFLKLPLKFKPSLPLLYAVTLTICIPAWPYRKFWPIYSQIFSTLMITQALGVAVINEPSRTWLEHVNRSPSLPSTFFGMSRDPYFHWSGACPRMRSKLVPVAWCVFRLCSSCVTQCKYPARKSQGISYLPTSIECSITSPESGRGMMTSARSGRSTT